MLLPLISIRNVLLRGFEVNDVVHGLAETTLLQIRSVRVSHRIPVLSCTHYTVI